MRQSKDQLINDRYVPYYLDNSYDKVVKEFSFLDDKIEQTINLEINVFKGQYQQLDIAQLRTEPFVGELIGNYTYPEDSISSRRGKTINYMRVRMNRITYRDSRRIRVLTGGEDFYVFNNIDNYGVYNKLLPYADHSQLKETYNESGNFVVKTDIEVKGNHLSLQLPEDIWLYKERYGYFRWIHIFVPGEFNSFEDYKQKAKAEFNRVFTTCVKEHDEVINGVIVRNRTMAKLPWDK